MPHKMMNSQIADVLHDNRLSIEARMLYAYLCSFDDGVPPSTCQIIRQLGIGLINNNNKAMNFKKERNDENAGEHN